MYTCVCTSNKRKKKEKKIEQGKEHQLKRKISKSSQENEWEGKFLRFNAELSVERVVKKVYNKKDPPTSAQHF